MFFFYKSVWSKFHFFHLDGIEETAKVAFNACRYITPRRDVMLKKEI